MNIPADAPRYRLIVPSQAAGADAELFDLFNATTSALDLYVQSVVPVVDGATAVTGTLAVNLNLNRTSAIGTGGTAATWQGTTFTAATISPLNPGSPPPSGITARLTPTGGATPGAWLGFDSVFTEETNAGTYTPRRNMLPSILTVPMGTGISVVQGAVASVGNLAFVVDFFTVRK